MKLNSQRALEIGQRLLEQYGGDWSRVRAAGETRRDTDEIKCGNCDAPLKAEAAGSPCPNCGSNARHLTLRFHDHVGPIRDTLRGKVKDEARSGKAKVRSEFFYGADKRKSRGDYVYKEREIDRDADRYREYVAEESGEVIRDVEEPLSAHVGHGSANMARRASPGGGQT